MKVLAIDTSNYPLGVALLDGDQVIGEYITNVKRIILSGLCRLLIF